MQLKDLYKNFGTSTPDEQAEFVAQYRLRRASDLESTPTVQRKKSTTKTTGGLKITLSEEEKLLMKMLGLKQKDILAARMTNIQDEELKNNGAELLKDSTFDEGDEE